MKFYIAGNGSMYKIMKEYSYDKKYCASNLLQTFYDLRSMKQKTINDILSSCDSFLLDSGAFSFMNGAKTVNWKNYIDKYVNFINMYDIQHFFELDLYTLPAIGVENTKRIRSYIEKRTKRQSIPVFHSCLGMKGYRELCEEYTYIGMSSTGTLTGTKWVKNKNLLCQVVRIASSYGTKVHGLGYGRLSQINDWTIPFYSCDSTGWIGSKFNNQYDMKCGRIVAAKKKKPGERYVNSYEVAKNNYDVFAKKQKMMGEKENEQNNQDDNI